MCREDGLRARREVKSAYKYLSARDREKGKGRIMLTAVRPSPSPR